MNAMRKQPEWAAERGRLRRALRALGKRLREIVESAPVGILQTRPDGTIERANSALTGMLGYSSEFGLRGTKMAAHVYPDDAVLLERFVQASETASLDLRLMRKDGSPIWVQLALHPVRESKRPAGLQFFVSDIDGRKRAEEDLRTADEKLSVVFLSAPAGIAVSTVEEGRLLEANREFARLFGYAREEVLGRSSLELGLWPDPSERRKHVGRIVAAGEGRNVLLRLRAKDGRSLVHRWDVRLVGMKGQSCLLSVLLDVTAEKQADEELRRAERRFSASFNENPIALAVSELQSGRIVAVNRAMVRMLRASSAEQLVGRTLAETGMFFAEDGQQRMLEALRLGRAREMNVPMRRLDGEPFLAELAPVSYEIDRNAYLLTSVVDITPPLQANQHRPGTNGENSARKRAEAANSLQGTETILVAEDNFAVNELVTKVLTNYGYRVLTAGNGESALKLAAQHSGPIHLLITDVSMPDMNGPALAERLTAQRAGLRVLYMSGHTEEAIKRYGLAGVPLLPKPFTPIRLAQEVRRLLNRRA
jgi:PAS domain S-box-containing protein